MYFFSLIISSVLYRQDLRFPLCLDVCRPKVITLTGTLTDTGENRISTMLGSDILDKFLNQDCLTNTGTTKQTDLPPFA